MIAACRDCAQPPLGGPSENPFTAYDSLCSNAACCQPGAPQVYVNTADLTLFVQVTDLVFGGQDPALSLQRAYHLDDPRGGPFGAGWSFNLGDTLTPEADGAMLLRRGSGRIDRFAPGMTAGAFFAVSATSDALTRNADGGYTLSSPASNTSRLFSSAGRLLSIRDGAATRVALEYDSAGLLTGARSRGRSLRFSYDAAGRVTSVADTAGRTVTYSYTADGRLSQHTNADGRTVIYRYADSGPLTGVAYMGGVTTVGYAADGPYVWVASLTTPDGATRQYDVSQAPRQIRVTNPNGDATFYIANAAGLVESVTDAYGNQTVYAYDSAGRRTRVTNGEGETVRFDYDAGGNLTAVTDAAGARWSAEYSGPGRPSRVTDPRGNAWQFRYDASGKRIGVTNPAGGASAATRSATGQITAVTDAAGNKTLYQYDADGLIAGFTDALGASWLFEHDGAARVQSRTDPGGSTLKASYTAANALASVAAGDNRLNFDSSGAQRDAQGRLTGYTDSFGNQIAYTYDGAGQLTSLTLPGGNAVTYEYDHARRLSKVSDWLGNFALYRYDSAGWPVSVSASGGPITIYQYDLARNLRATVSTGPDGSPVSGYRYTYDAAGNRTSVSALEPSSAQWTPVTVSASFDAASRPVSRGDESYRYDARGNLASIQGSRTATLTYDAFGRLQAADGGVSTSYGYDSNGLRATRSSGGTSHRFVWDLSGARPRVVAELDESNAPVAWYVYGLGLLWKVTPGGTTYFYHFDGDGNAVALSNPAAGVVNRYRYDPRGNLVAAEEGVENGFRARGESGWIDDGNGLVFGDGAYQIPELRLTLPAAVDLNPQAPEIGPSLRGAAACLTQGVAVCPAAGGRRER